MEDRETVRCKHCSLVQFAQSECRRCHRSLARPVQPDPKEQFWRWFIRRLRAIRRYKGISLSEAGRAVGMTCQNLSRMEARSRRPHRGRYYYFSNKVLERVARGYGVPLRWLLDPSLRARDVAAATLGHGGEPLCAEISSELAKIIGQIGESERCQVLKTARRLFLRKCPAPVVPRSSGR
jgi:transcriptional regulator with XRE-family HTH domain